MPTTHAITPQEALQRVIEHREIFHDEMLHIMRLIMGGEMSPALMAAFISALRVKKETIGEITAAAQVMREFSNKVHVTDTQHMVDIVGTGGDQLHTVNVSTMAAFVVAGAGVPVAKHGNRAASSSVGSADVLESLGVKLDLPPAVISDCLHDASMAFIFAPSYHHALGYIAPIRRALAFRTVFNVLGPLANPAGVRRGVVGVAPRRLLEPMSQVLAARGAESMALVHGDDGLDELSLGGPSTVFVVTPNGIEQRHVDAPAELGRHADVAALRGGGAADNADVVRRFLDGEAGPVHDAVCANAALALQMAGRASSLRDGFELAEELVTSGAASTVLDRLVRTSNQPTA